MDPDKYANASTEHAQQVALFMWAAQNREKYPQLEWMFAVPNGGERNVAVAARLKAEGVRSGVSDIFLPAPGYTAGFVVAFGLFIEMKKPKSEGKAAGRESENQAKFGAHVTTQGYRYVVCYSFQEARDAIIEYLTP